MYKADPGVGLPMILQALPSKAAGYLASILVADTESRELDVDSIMVELGTVSFYRAATAPSGLRTRRGALCGMFP